MLSFMLMLSAYAMRCAKGYETTVAGVEIICAATLGLAGFFCFRKIRVHDDADRLRSDFRLDVLSNVREAIDVVIRNGRYRRYLVGCFLEGFFGMLYLPLIAAFLSKTLEFGYIECAALTHGIPTLMAFLTTALLGRWLDRTNPWISWAWVRFAFGLDALLLAATPLGIVFLPAIIFILPTLGRMLRGSVQGGWFVLWWQIGITHFAPPGEDTSRYAGIMVFLNGVIKIAAATAGIGLMAMQVEPVTLLWIGGVGVIGFLAFNHFALRRHGFLHHFPRLSHCTNLNAIPP